MIERALGRELEGAAGKYPVVTVTGPRQSGKTTLVRAVFSKHAYATLEDPELRRFALEDPRGFLAQFKGPVVLDEVQRAPELFSYIQVVVDEERRAGRFVLSGSQNFLLLRSISQSLAGRSAVFHLLPFSLSELLAREAFPLERIGREIPEGRTPESPDVMETLLRGFFPRVIDLDLDPGRWYADYYQTYIERDVRQIEQVGDLESFSRFVRLCAGRNGHLLNLSSLGNDAGVSHSTARRWLSTLQASFLVTLLQPHHRSFNKRLIKSPKLYFLDTGLLCYLLRIRSPRDLATHASRGPIFETFVLSELTKNFLNRGREPDLYFWRDSAGHEVDFLIDDGARQIPLEVKSGQTFAGDFMVGLDYWRKLVGDAEFPAGLVYAGDRSFLSRGVAVYSWRQL